MSLIQKSGHNLAEVVFFFLLISLPYVDTFSFFFHFSFLNCFFLFSMQTGQAVEGRNGGSKQRRGDENNFSFTFFSFSFFSRGLGYGYQTGGEAFLYYNYVHETETCSLEVTYKCMYSINLYICSLFLVWFGGGGIFQYLSQNFFFLTLLFGGMPRMRTRTCV